MFGHFRENILTHTFTLLTLFVCSLGIPRSASAQNSVANVSNIRVINKNPNKYEGRIVRLSDGVFVSRILERNNNNGITRYRVRDNRGAAITILTKSNPPEVGESYAIKGRVEKKSTSSDSSVLVYELGRTSPRPWLLYSIIGLFVVVVGLGIYVIVQRNRKKKNRSKKPKMTTDSRVGDGKGVETEQEYGLKAMKGKKGTDEVDDIPERGVPSPRNVKQESQNVADAGNVDVPGEDGDRITETETIKYKTPPRETVKMLGRLEVITGHDEPEIPLLVPAGDRGNSGKSKEYTIGRASATPGEKDSHIQLKPRTVSRKQAKLSVRDRTFRLTNLASEQKNPTLVNGTALDVGDQIELANGDVITMGEVKLRLHIGV